MSDRLRPQWAGHRLRQVRAVTLMLGLVTVALYTAGVPLYYRDLVNGCLTIDCGYGLVFAPSAAAIAAMGLSVPVYVLALTLIEVAHAWFFFALAALVFVRVPRNPVAFLGALFLLSWGATHSNPLYALAAAVPPVQWLAKFLAFLSTATLFAFFSVFPSGQFVPRLMRYLLVAWSVIVAVVEFGPADAAVSDNPVLVVITLLALLGFFLSLIVAQVYRYRRVSTPMQREQTKWVVFGVALGIVAFWIVLSVGAFASLTPSPPAWWGLAYHLGIFGSTLIIPLALLRAVLQSGLWSIDLIIRRTLIYALLTAALVGVYFTVVVVLQAVVAVVTGEARSTLVTVLSTLAIAALFSPLRLWVQGVIDRRFYRHKYDAARTLAAFGATIRDDVDLDALVGRLLGVVDETMQPAATWLWLHPEVRSAPEHGGAEWRGRR